MKNDRLDTETPLHEFIQLHFQLKAMHALHARDICSLITITTTAPPVESNLKLFVV